MKKFYKENRVFVILMGIVLVCVIVMLVMATKYVIKSNTNNTYGNRLDGIKDVKITNKMKSEMESKIKEMNKVSSVKINVHGKIVYFDIDFDNEATLDEVKGIAIKCLELFKEEYKNFYDMQFLFTKSKSTDEEEKFPIIGYMKAGATTVSWSNNAK